MCIQKHHDHSACTHIPQHHGKVTHTAGYAVCRENIAVRGLRSAVYCIITHVYRLFSYVNKIDKANLNHYLKIFLVAITAKGMVVSVI